MPPCGRRDHPRSRGVYASTVTWATVSAGSSPLARGLRPQRVGPGGDPGIIPARAGFTRRRFSASSGVGDHPRSRGVYEPLRLGVADAVVDHPRSRGVYRNINSEIQETGGSSPLARGLLHRVQLLSERPRIIPARAGFTCRARSPTHYPQDHPRSRGVYHSRRPASMRHLGSSPLARGLLNVRPLRSRKNRIIPARAGFTTRLSVRSCTPTDHPRSRGVYQAETRGVVAAAGSSPLARGLLGGTPVPGMGDRIIPARAGFTRHRVCGHVEWGDHPRSRGVYLSLSAFWLPRNGSSPLARGLRRNNLPVVQEVGIIPARAGFTPRLPRGPSGPSDHPRSRGVYCVRVRPRQILIGSSPLARGLRLAQPPRPHDHGIIPARAGFTCRPTTCR